MLNPLARFFPRLYAYIPIFSSIGFSGAILLLAKISQAASMDWYALIAIDYLVWVTAAFSFISIYLDYSRFYNEYGFGSTLSLNVIALALIILGRFSSIIHSMIYTGFKTPLIGGCAASAESVALASPVIFGGILAFVVTIAHALLKKPLVLAHGPSFGSLHASIKILFSRAIEFISSHYLAFAFLTCFIFRLIPELRYPDFPIGYDTVEYIAYLRDYALSLNPFQTYNGRNAPPLMPILMTPFLAATDPWNLMKAWGPLMCGLSGLLSALVARRVFGLSRGVSLLAGLVGGLNIIAIGSTQQWHRHMLGVVFLLAYIASNAGSSNIFRLTTLFGMAMAYEPTAAISVALSTYHAAKSKKGVRLAYIAVLALSLILLIWYMRRPIVTSPITGISVAGIIDSGFPNTTVDLMVWCCVFLLPLAPALLVLKRMPGGYRFLLLILALAVIQPALMPYTSLLEQHRWASMLVFALIPAATAGYIMIDRKLLSAFSVVALLIGAVYVVVPNSNFYLSPLSGAWEYRYQQGFPWELEPALSAYEYQNLREISAKLQEIDGPTLMSIGVYPWIHLDIRNPKNLFCLGYEPCIDDVARYMNRSGARSVYVVTGVDLDKNMKNILSLNLTYSELIVQIKLETIVHGSRALYHVYLEE